MSDAKDIYRRFIHFEEQAAAIYLRMASRFSPENPELSALWLEMGIQKSSMPGCCSFVLQKNNLLKSYPQTRKSKAPKRCFHASCGKHRLRT